MKACFCYEIKMFIKVFNSDISSFISHNLEKSQNLVIFIYIYFLLIMWQKQTSIECESSHAWKYLTCI